MRVLLLFFIVFSSITSNFLAQSKVEVKVVSFTDKKVVVATLDTNYLFPWNNRILSALEKFFINENSDLDVRVLVTMAKGKSANIEISSRPQLKKEKVDNLFRRLGTLARPPRSKLTEYSYLIELKIGGGCKNPQLTFLPKINMPEQKVKLIYKAADLREKIVLFQSWIKEDVVPVLSYYQDTLRTKLKGVNAIGEILRTGSYMDRSIDETTIKNSAYWHACMEVESGDGLIILSKISMHIAKGEFDMARRYLNVAQAFPEQNSMALNYYNQFNSRMEWLYEDIKEEIQKGKKMQVAGDYKAAERHYSSMLKVFPNSAAFNYELYYSKSLLLSNGEPERIIQLWKDCKTTVYSCDPLFNMNVPSRNSKDAYLMSKRHKINILFDNQTSIQENILEYADIALDLAVYGFAAHMYWLILDNKPKEFSKRDILAHYLYCLEKLGDTENIIKYEKEYSRQKFRKIEKERIRIMESSKVYNRSLGSHRKASKEKQKKNRK